MNLARACLAATLVFACNSAFAKGEAAKAPEVRLPASDGKVWSAPKGKKVVAVFYRGDW